MIPYYAYPFPLGSSVRGAGHNSGGTVEIWVISTYCEESLPGSVEVRQRNDNIRERETDVGFISLGTEQDGC